MHSSFLLVAASCVVAVSACAQPAGNEWQAPTATDKRGPCPLVNSLANHGFLARNGLNISMANLLVALNASVNLAAAATELVGAKALTTGNGVTFNLDDLDKHNIIEHDGSLSRADTFSGDNHSFNETIWNVTASSFTGDTIDISVAAAARSTRLVNAKAQNPQFNMTAANIQFSLIESSLYLNVMANGTSGSATTAVTEWVNVLFREERLPYKEGWVRPEQITTAAVLEIAQLVAAA